MRDWTVNWQDATLVAVLDYYDADKRHPRIRLIEEETGMPYGEPTAYLPDVIGDSANYDIAVIKEYGENRGILTALTDAGILDEDELGTLIYDSYRNVDTGATVSVVQLSHAWLDAVDPVPEPAVVSAVPGSGTVDDFEYDGQEPF
jgi:hypothetical protein